MTMLPIWSRSLPIYLVQPFQHEHGFFVYRNRFLGHKFDYAA